ncbi:hypothetical protein [Paenibacillus sp. FSL L8-0463]|uniref:hypothetical protein n=1 Tax=Paenibacillus sp. FSL L8-0463 TaxID=2954687 RepID=UPI003119DE21
MNQTANASIPLVDICSIFKGTIIDVYYVIKEQEHIYKSEILQKFVEHDDDPNCKPTKYRLIMDIAVAKLEGACLIASYNDGAKERYFRTEYGIMAEDILSHMLDQTPSILHGSKILAKILNVGANK